MNSTITLTYGGKKSKNGRDNTKWTEKPYSHCGPQAEKVIKSTQSYYGRKL